MDRRREEEMELKSAMDRGQVAGQGNLSTLNRVTDRHIIIKTLHQRAHECEAHATGYRRLADLIGAASEHDYALFAVVLEKLK